MKTALELSQNLNSIGHHTTENGVQVAMNANAEAKATLNEMFSKHPNYNGNGQIVIDEEFERDMDAREIRRCVDNFPTAACASKYILSKLDSEGKTLEERIVSQISLPSTLKAKDAGKMEGLRISDLLSVFRNDGYTNESANKLNKLMNLTNCFRDVDSTRVGTYLVNRLSDCNVPDILRFTPEMKTSKAFNKIWSYYGMSGKKEYEKAFAEYADLVSDGKRKVKIVISTTLVDFLRMSWGVNWASCHTTDPEWRRPGCNRNGDCYHGMYMGGCLSYALDGVSFIVKVINKDADPTHPEDWDNIYRCVFQYKDGYLLQGRVYPQAKDGATDLYTKIRNIVQREICKALGVDYIENGATGDSWVRLGGIHNAEGKGILTINTRGHHYKDYYSFDDCNLSKLKAVAEEKHVELDIGHGSICLGCGREEDGNFTMRDGSLTCYRCRSNF